MKKTVPDPPRNKPITNPFFSIRAYMCPPDALTHASEIAHSLVEHAQAHLHGQQAQE